MSRNLVLVLVVLLAGLGQSLGAAVTPRDLARDEASGGHTLARHVGQTVGQLGRRLEGEHGISSASTYTDRATAERVVAETLAQASARVRNWASRRGPRPNLPLHYRSPDGRTIGSSMERAGSRVRPCAGALVVLRWDDGRHAYFVLTSYPEVRR